MEERGLDHLVVASCSPRFQGPTFERIARDLRLGENAVAFANLREGCSFIHKDEPERAQEKASKILEGAVARAQHQSDLPRQRTFLHRSALVVGGGIAGMTAAEELAASGIEVHLVERQPSLGGYMARLSKTFPTEDCAMCSLAPRLTSTALESRVHVHTLTEVEEITGPPGEFRVKLRHKPRYVSEACVGCGECVAGLPGEVPQRLRLRRERAQGHRPASSPTPCPARSPSRRRAGARARAPAPCTRRAQGYVALVAAGRFEDAYRVASEPNPFSSVCGRICTHLCETACARGKVDEPIAIAGLKRFVADTVGPDACRCSRRRSSTRRPWPSSAPAPPASPAPATWPNLGYQVTVFEAQPVAGGMLRTGIPDYRLPHDVIQREIDQILALGIELQLGRRAGADFTVDGLLRATATRPSTWPRACRRAPRRRCPATTCGGVTRAVEFLRELNLGGTPPRRREGRRDRRRRRGARRRPQRHPPAAAGRQASRT